ncbi:MAG: ABC transporter ATP-binding protein, partial [Spirochaetales bacterium]|nr:ABC transporter ATP-binding protein [Spirochaetales bacterium]
MIELKGAAKIYDLGGGAKVQALKGVDLSIMRGEFITVMGPSGSGKSTLLHILGILDDVDSGTYLLEESDLTTLTDRELSRIRNQHFGFIFQSFNLFNEFNAVENVMFPLMNAGMRVSERKEKARSLLSQVGLDERMYHYPNMLSGGEQQRVAIARALANDPTFILADEPTGNLPSQ